ncbi:MAG: four-carbon acid sugar kinase family protein [Candidatus Njordarchaeales archaeon]
MVFRYVIIADDLTGANDTGVQFTRYEYKSYVIIDPTNITEKIDRLRGLANVVVINTESRADPPEKAYKKCREVAEALRREVVEVVYKKVDSTMRGNIGVELDGVLDGLGRELALFTPAFPLNGRIVMGGYLLVHGSPLDLTPFADDPVSPVKEANVLSIIKKQSRRTIGHVSYDYVSGGVESIRKRVEELRGEANIIVFDAATQENLQDISLAIKDYYGEAIYSGSAGLARELPKAWGEKESMSEKKLSIEGSYVVCLCGSVNPATLEQVRHLKEHVDSEIIDIDASLILKNPEKVFQEIVKRARESISQGRRCIVVRSAKSREDVEKTQKVGQNMGLSREMVAGKIASFLGELGKAIATDVGKELAGMVITGGDIAINTCRKLLIDALEIVDEIDPGVPLTKATMKSRELYIVTKAGGFGKENTITKAVKLLLGEET